MRVLRFYLLLLGLGCAFVSVPQSAVAEDRKAIVATLATGSFNEKAQAIEAAAATGDPDFVPVLQAMADNRLFERQSDGRVVVGEPVGRNFRLLDAVTLEELEAVAAGALERVRVNNRVRRALSVAIGSMTLLSPDPGQRIRAAQSVFRSGDPGALETLDQALLQETNARAQAALELARAAVILNTDVADAVKIEALGVIAARGNRDALTLLNAFRSQAEGDLATAADQGVASIERRLKSWEMAQHVTYGISLGSVLLLAAIGLAITFGVMGVINMAHGEMVMLGAYTTFVVQQAIRTHYPELFDASLFIAIPLAFAVTGAVGIAIERGIIRWLYGRRSRPCSPPGACRWSCSRPCAASSAPPIARSATRPGCRARWRSEHSRSP